MPVIDAHTHLGEDRVFGLDASEEDLLGGMEAASIDVSLVQPYPGPISAKATHDRIAALAKKHPGRVCCTR